MIPKVKEIIRDIKLYELGIKDKPDGYDELMSLSGLKPFKVEGYETYYGKTNDIKFRYYHRNLEYVFIERKVWFSIGDSFKLFYNEAQELTMWSIGSDPNLKGVRNTMLFKVVNFSIGDDPI